MPGRAAKSNPKAFRIGNPLWLMAIREWYHFRVTRATGEPIRQRRTRINLLPRMHRHRTELAPNAREWHEWASHGARFPGDEAVTNDAENAFTTFYRCQRDASLTRCWSGHTVIGRPQEAVSAPPQPSLYS
jgi:hypothetical protein